MNTLVLAISLTMAGQLEAQPFKDNQVRVENGILQGTSESSGIRLFKGIPFAQPPVGKLRWQPPQPANDWQGVRQANQFGPRAMQGKPAYDTSVRTDQMSEDCLYLNVWTPAKNSSDRLPVLVWFYGGGFQGGDGSEVRYDGESMAERRIVYVTVNYRLGIFGFLAHPELTKESPHHASGDYGLLDQTAALQWVRKNIAAFGGDPKRVTIAGQSAGSLSVCAQMASPLAKDLFSGAIGESGSVLGTLTPISLKEAEQTGMQFAANAGFDSLAQLRAASADELYQAASRAKTRFHLVVDGYFFPKDPVAIFAQGEQSQVPLLVGWTSREGSYQSILKDSPSKENFEKAVKQLYPNDWQAVLAAYAPTSAEPEAVIQAAADLAADRFIGYSTWKWAAIHGSTSKQPVYRYSFAWEKAPLKANLEKAGIAVTDQRPRSRFAAHSAEIEYAWGNLAKTTAFAWSAEDYKVSQAMHSYFANFIKTGNPNGPGLPNWPAITPNQPAQFMRFDVTPGPQVEQHQDRYLLLDRLTNLENAHAAPEPTAKAAPASKPNILVILADDLGYGDVGCFGCKDIPTPNLDSLAKNGVRFTDGYVTAPLCGPSRAGLLTGRSGTRFGFEENVGGSPIVKGGDNLAGIPVSERIFSEYMKAAGYATGVFGKWHIGFAPPLVPPRRGFDEWECFFGGAHSYFPGPMGGKKNEGNGDPDPIVHNGEKIPSFDYTTYLFAKAAADFIGQHRSQPWFVYLPFNAVHGPLGATEALKQRFPNLSGKRQTYAGMLSAMDDGVGMVMARLRECGLEENTLIFFTSDNGGPTAVTTSSNFPLSGFKGQLWEGGIREPFIIQWKGRIPAGQVFSSPVSSLDVLPTALTVAGAPLNPILEGVNLLPYLTGEKTGVPNPMLCWRINGQRAIRMGDWKLLDMAQGEGWKLFNLASDIAEKNDLREKEPAKVAELEAAFNAWDAKNVPAKWLFNGAATEYGQKTLSKGLRIDNELDEAPPVK